MYFSRWREILPGLPVVAKTAFTRNLKKYFGSSGYGVAGIVCCFFFFGLLLAGCEPVKEERGQVVERDNDGFPIEVIDYGGRKLRFEEPPQSFVSTLPSITEILFALELGDRVKAVTTYCDYPPDIETRSMGWGELDQEMLSGLVPDLIIAGQGQQYVADISQLVPDTACFILAPRSFDEIPEAILLLGEITGREEQALLIAEEMVERKEQVVREASQVPSARQIDVMVLASPDELVAAGDKTFAGELVKMAGGNNLAAEKEGYYTLEKEKLFELDPEVIIFLAPWEQLLVGEDWPDELQAFQLGQVYHLDVALLTRPGPRMADGLEEIFSILHRT